MVWFWTMTVTRIQYALLSRWGENWYATRGKYFHFFFKNTKYTANDSRGVFIKRIIDISWKIDQKNSIFWWLVLSHYRFAADKADRIVKRKISLRRVLWLILSPRHSLSQLGQCVNRHALYHTYWLIEFTFFCWSGKIFT